MIETPQATMLADHVVLFHKFPKNVGKVVSISGVWKPYLSRKSIYTNIP